MTRIVLSVQKFYLLLVLLAILSCEIVFWTLHRLGWMKFEAKIDVAGLTAIPLLLIGIFELYRQANVRRATFITEYVSKFYTETELHDSFNDLIATYRDAKFEEIKKAVANARAESMLAAFSATSELQDGRKEGSRFYHPDHFQGSVEEQRLDALLGYFDVIGYQYAHGFVRIADVVGMLGYQLSLVMSREVIKKYLEGTDLRWWNSTSQSKESALVPYVYLRALLAGFKRYNIKYQSRLTDQFNRTQRQYEELRNSPLR
jgi:hypothetical protein